MLRLYAGLPVLMEDLLFFGGENTMTVQDTIEQLREAITSLEDYAASTGAEPRDDTPLTSAPTPAADVNYKAMSFDTLSEAVSSAIYRLNPDEWNPMMLRTSCAAVYKDYCIIRKGIAHYKAGYTVEEHAITIADEADWKLVEPSWKELSSGTSDKSGESPIETDLSYRHAPIIILPDRSSVIKSIGKNRVGHYAILFGDQTEKDVYGEWFDATTEDVDTVFKAVGALPGLYHHAMDRTIKTEPVIIYDTMEKDDMGWWVEGELRKASQYMAAYQKLLEANVLGSSTGCLPKSRKVAPNGHIERWGVIEISSTWGPADGRQRTLPIAELKSMYTDIGLTIPDLGSSGDEGAEEARRLADLEREHFLMLTL